MLIFPAPECPRAPQAFCLVARFTLLPGNGSSDLTTRSFLGACLLKAPDRMTFL
ncbi:MAG: hypothetical protein INF74_17020 [Roseomonas sp.]|nr:hypothetical protein [Roseomonas sp.]